MDNQTRTFTPDQELRALSWKQPYGELMLHGKIETRTWDTKYRGWVLICASKAPYSDLSVKNIAGLIQYKRITDTLYRSVKEYGAAIGIGYLADCRRMLPEDEDKCFVRYFSDLYCHVYTDVRPIMPFDWKGAQGWRKVSEEVKRNIVIL